MDCVISVESVGVVPSSPQKLQASEPVPTVDIAYAISQHYSQEGLLCRVVSTARHLAMIGRQPRLPSAGFC